jgi:uncharacterized protein YggU (UPF0235/DUF167 family)
MEALKLVQNGDGALVAQLAAPPIDGAANEELVAGLARVLHPGVGLRTWAV